MSAVEISLLLLLLGNSTLDGGSSGDVEASDSSEGSSSDSLVDVGKTLDNFSDSVDASSKHDVGGEELALGVVLSLGDLVVALVSLEEGHDSLAALLALSLDAGEADGGSDGGGVVEVSQGHGVVSPLLSVELNQLGVPFLSKLPHNFAGDLHSAYTQNAVNHHVIRLPYLLERPKAYTYLCVINN